MADNWKIKVRLKEAMEFLQNKGYEVVCINLYGSQNYGLDTEESDIDLKAVVLPSLDDIINNISPISTSLEFKDGLIDVKDIRLMFENYKKQNTNYLETLFTPYWIGRYPYYTDWIELRNMAEDIARADEVKAVKAMYGMALQKQAALCHPYPSKVDLIEKYGYDAKQLCHIIRLYCMLDYYTAPLLNRYTYEDILHLRHKKKLIESLKKIKTYKTAFTAEQATNIAASYVNLMKKKVDKIVSMQENYPVMNRAYILMDKIKASLMKKYFRTTLGDI